MKTLKAHYLDSEAKAAGAESSVLYTSGALKARALLQHSAPVKVALAEAWSTLQPEEGEGGDMERVEYVRLCTHRPMVDLP